MQSLLSSRPSATHVRSRASWAHPPDGMGGFEFVALASLRAAQLIRGCTPTVETNIHKSTVIAQMEVAAGHIRRAIVIPDALVVAAAAEVTDSASPPPDAE